MTFVPTVIHVPPPPSRRARELGEKIRTTIQEYRYSDPATTSTDIRQALDLVASEAGGGKQAALAVVLIGLLVLGLLAGLFYFRSGGGPAIGSMIPVVLGVIVLVGLVAVISRARR